MIWLASYGAGVLITAMLLVWADRHGPPSLRLPWWGVFAYLAASLLWPLGVVLLAGIFMVLLIFGV